MLKSGVFGICCVCATLAAQTYVPQNVGEFYPEPGKTARLTVKAGEGAALPESLSYSLLDYSGKNVGSGMFKRKGETLETSLTLNRGFYELDLGKQRIGLSVLESSSRVPDRFFALETLLNYDSPEKIRQMMAVLKKSRHCDDPGISLLESGRERARKVGCPQGKALPACPGVRH